jgi:hypothetical protein
MMVYIVLDEKIIINIFRVKGFIYRKFIDGEVPSFIPQQHYSLRKGNKN